MLSFTIKVNEFSFSKLLKDTIALIYLGRTTCFNGNEKVSVRFRHFVVNHSNGSVYCNLSICNLCMLLAVVALIIVLSATSLLV